MSGWTPLAHWAASSLCAAALLPAGTLPACSSMGAEPLWETYPPASSLEKFCWPQAAFPEGRR